jgi:hypothetical protein
MSDYNIGAKIKKMRLAKKMTLQAVAKEKSSKSGNEHVRFWPLLKRPVPAASNSVLRFVSRVATMRPRI